MAYTQTITQAASIFTPPASCTADWTYEAAYYNSVPNGLLIQNAIPESMNTDCFPSGFDGNGRAPSAVQVFSPGACPVGYTTAANSYNSPATTAICCPSDFSYLLTYSSINYYSSSAAFMGCISNYPSASGYTTVVARANGNDLNTTSVEGPITMWAQPVAVAFRSKDISLFTTTSASATSVGSAVGNTASSSTVTSASARGAPSSGSASATSTSSSSSSSGSSSGSQLTNNSTSNTGLSGGAIAGIAIGCAAIVGLLIGVAIFFALRRRRERRAATPGPPAPEKDQAQQNWDGSQQYGNPQQPQYYDPPPQEMPTIGYGKSIRRAEKPADPIPTELMGERDPVEMG